ncbi:hypothetical protein F1D05_10285 [Kribbella qitaiheensis]|uniref:Phosphotyrosine protein phosphatase I domain-containing protein n=1 Tax=Kribbella qitaiheensis TaxID=1544730 RepID=A0A7G6WW48_9ACTN|nr:hypothetical protein F1D05_10285 [Kribbella qitaiheensis]
MTEPPLWRRALAEALGTGLLVTVVVGSGIAAASLSRGDVGLQLLENSFATALGLAVLILMLGPVSGAHFNPVVSVIDWWLGQRTGTGPARPRPRRLHPHPDRRGRSRGHSGQPHVRSSRDLLVNPRPIGGPPLYRGDRRDRGSDPADLRARLVRPSPPRTARSRRLHRLGVLVHFVDVVRQPSRHHRTRLQRHLRRHRTQLRAPLHRLPGLRRHPRRRPGRRPLPERGRLRRRRRHPTHRHHCRSVLVSKPAVLFVCIHNAGRSQMAAGWLRHLAGDTVEIRSAGSEPANQINPIAIEAMREVGVEITGNTPQLLESEAVRDSDVVITMGCGDACPIFPGKRYEDWELIDPAGQPIEVVREVRDDIRGRVEKLVADLQPG